MRDFTAPPCPADAPVVQADRDQVFVEALVADVSRAAATEATLASLDRVLSVPDAAILGTPHWIGTYDEPGTLELTDVQGQTPRASLHRLKLLARHAESAVTVLDLELTLQLANPNAVSPTPTRRVSLSLTARDDLSSVAQVPWSVSRSLLVVVRPRAVRSERDLRTLFECKMQRRLRQPAPP